MGIQALGHEPAYRVGVELHVLAGADFEASPILITTAYPNLAAWEEAQEKTEGDAEFQSLRRQAEATGRKIVSSLLVQERPPR